MRGGDADYSGPCDDTEVDSVAHALAHAIRYRAIRANSLSQRKLAPCHQTLAAARAGWGCAFVTRRGPCNLDEGGCTCVAYRRTGAVRHDCRRNGRKPVHLLRCVRARVGTGAVVGFDVRERGERPSSPDSFAVSLLDAAHKRTPSTIRDAIPTYTRASSDRTIRHGRRLTYGSQWPSRAPAERTDFGHPGRRSNAHQRCHALNWRRCRRASLRAVRPFCRRPASLTIQDL
jgi:hypothetical protein